MNALDIEIRKSILQYPRLYAEKARLGVLDHLYLVIGNGYEWKDGYLVPCGEDPEEYLNSPDIVEADLIDTFEKWLDRTSIPLRMMTKKRIENAWIEDLMRAQYARDNIDRLVTERLEPEVDWAPYTPWDYSKIMCIPSDVRHEYLDGAKEILLALKAWVPKIKAWNPDEEKNYRLVHDLEFLKEGLHRYEWAIEELEKRFA